MSDPAFSNITPEKMKLMAYLLFTPMTPEKFRSELDKHQGFKTVATMYDSYIRIQLHKKNPIKAEADTLNQIRWWWISCLSVNDRTALQQKYYGKGLVFFINLTRNLPYGNNPPLITLRNGVPIWELEKHLTKMLDAECISVIMKEINLQGGPGYYYQVRIVPSDPQGNNFSVGVRRYTPDELLKEVERQNQKRLKKEPSGRLHG